MFESLKSWGGDFYLAFFRLWNSPGEASRWRLEDSSCSGGSSSE
jgi:hypothetical protein